MPHIRGWRCVGFRRCDRRVVVENWLSNGVLLCDRGFLFVMINIGLCIARTAEHKIAH